MGNEENEVNKDDAKNAGCVGLVLIASSFVVASIAVGMFLGAGFGVAAFAASVLFWGAFLVFAARKDIREQASVKADQLSDCTMDLQQYVPECGVFEFNCSNCMADVFGPVNIAYFPECGAKVKEWS